MLRDRLRAVMDRDREILERLARWRFAEYPDLADYLLIAEAVLGVPAESIARWPGIGLAESTLHAPARGFEGVEFYSDVIDKAAVHCVRLARNHPLPDGDKRVAYLAMLEFLARNRVERVPPSVGLAAGGAGVGPRDTELEPVCS